MSPLTKAVQLDRDSRFDSSTPRTQRRPSPLIPIATKTAWLWITPSSRTFSLRASRIRYGYASSSRRSAKRRRTPSRLALIRLMVLAENVCPHSSSVEQRLRQ